MTPEEKAKDLIAKFKPLVFGHKQTTIDNNAKHCAIICAEAVKNQVAHYDTICFQYWQSVLTNLESQ